MSENIEKNKPWLWPENKWRAIVSKVSAGRSLKPQSWPRKAKVAVAISFDSDHETSVLRWGSESIGQISQGEYGSRKGIPRILETLSRYNVQATFFVPAVSALLHSKEIQLIHNLGHEIGLHGWIHEINSDLELEDEKKLMDDAISVLSQLTGIRPTGIRTPSWDFSKNTAQLIKEFGLLYDSSLMADDDPYELLIDGKPSGIIELPVEWIRDDAVYFNMARFSSLRPYTSPNSVLEIFKSEFNGALRENGLFLLTMHPHFIGHRSRIDILEQLLDYISNQDTVWFASHYEIAKYCNETFSVCSHLSLK